jgi:predicted Rossmann fold nucleotide-binding protein DprA/Smf involved in DNA uptake
VKSRVEEPVRIRCGEPGYPAALRRLGTAAPESIAMHGQPALLEEELVAVFCSVQAPAGAVFGALDLARELAESTSTVAGGFQSPLEREMLALLLRGTVPLVVCPARGIEGLRIPAVWRAPLREGRLLILSPFAASVRRPTLAAAEIRNRVVAALSSRILLLHASSGGRLARLASEALGWGVPVQCLDDPSNEDLRVMGASPIVAAVGGAPRDGWARGPAPGGSHLAC